jgi:glycerophosphoryl diester phosphodiesterase
LNRVIISSFHHPWLLRIMEKEPQLEVQALVGDSDTDPLDFRDCFFSTYNANAGLIRPDQIRALKDRGKKINLFTVNDPRDFSRFSELGVDGIFTDFPQWFVKKIGEK